MSRLATAPHARTLQTQARWLQGKVLVAPGTVIALTKTLWIQEKPSDASRKNHHCERRPLLRSAGCGGGWG